MTTLTFALASHEFTEIRDLLYDICGINLQSGKEGLVTSRLSKRLRKLGHVDFAAYLRHVRDDPKELSELVDALTTNKTSFFRESQHFDFLTEAVLPTLAERGDAARFWSAGCSTGEEPYTLAMVLSETRPAARRLDARILATDISSRALAQARAGRYSAATVADVPSHLLQRHFVRERAPGDDRYRVGEAVRRLVTFARLNLMAHWPMRGPFDVILCRNVMIYFDRPTQQRLVDRFADLLAPSGYLIVGHSESLTALSHRLTYVQPAVYVRE